MYQEKFAKNSFDKFGVDVAPFYSTKLVIITKDHDVKDMEALGNSRFLE